MNDGGRSPGGDSSPESWTKVVIESNPGGCEEIAVFLTWLTGRGTESVPAAGSGKEGRERVIGYLEDTSQGQNQQKKLDTFLAELGQRDPQSSPKTVFSGPIPREDWLEAWKKHFRVTRVTPGLAVRPPWEEHIPARGEKVIVIDPGMAFGTGLHASTRLTLSFIDDLHRKTGTVPIFPEKVLDVGTGTGILAMACALFGAKEVLAIDSDPQAVEAARRNVASNGLGEKITVSWSLLTGVQGTFELIAANILFDTLARLASDLASRLDEGGTLLCAGILAGRQEEDLRQIFQDLGLRCTGERTMGEWSALRFSF